MEQTRRFTGRQITVMVVAMCVAVIAAPIGAIAAIAATGTLVNITDPVKASQKARVTSNGAVQAAVWAGVPSGYVDTQQGHFGIGGQSLVQTNAGHRLAVTQVTVTANGTGTTALTLDNWIIPSTGDCSNPTAATFSLKVLRTVNLPADSTVQLTWNGPALYPPSPGTGKKACLNFVITQTGGGAVVGVTGYRF